MRIVSALHRAPCYVTTATTTDADIGKEVRTQAGGVNNVSAIGTLS